MSRPPLSPASERGIALIVVLLLLAVMSGLIAGMTINGQTEVAMASNERSFAGARASAEAGMNRAIEAITNNTNLNFLAGPDGLVNAGNPAAAENADNGKIASLLTGASPYALDSAGQYTYTIQILDDDDPSLYPTALSAGQLTAMAEDGSAYTNINDRLIIRATGYGPNSTVVSVSRILETVDTLNTTTTNTTTLTDPAMLINGSLTINGNPTIAGTKGSVHANLNLAINGNAASVSKDATSSGTFSANQNWHAGGTQGGGRPTVNVPDVLASNYISHADYKLRADGKVQTVSTGALCNSPCMNWTFSGGGWNLTGNTATSGTFYAYTDVTVSGNPGAATPIALSIIAEGNITITGNPAFRPENAAFLQFVTNKDLRLSGNIDVDYQAVEGQILVREQLQITGNPQIRGQVIVQNATSISNLVTANTVSGNPHFNYDGSFADMVTIVPGPSTTTTTYVNNVSGWLES